MMIGDGMQGVEESSMMTPDRCPQCFGGQPQPGAIVNMARVGLKPSCRKNCVEVRQMKGKQRQVLLELMLSKTKENMEISVEIEKATGRPKNMMHGVCFWKFESTFSQMLQNQNYI